LAAQDREASRDALLDAIADMLERAFSPPARGAGSGRGRARGGADSPASKAGKAIVRQLVEAGLARLQAGSTPSTRARR
ncbi:MAG: hypothetical protein ACK4F7_04140, partial [Inhella sp.]